MTIPTRVGGARPGAGRKPLEGGRVTASFVLRQDQAGWLEAQEINTGESKSAVMRALIDKAMKRAT